MQFKINKIKMCKIFTKNYWSNSFLIRRDFTKLADEVTFDLKKKGLIIPILNGILKKQNLSLNNLMLFALFIFFVINSFEDTPCFCNGVDPNQARIRHNLETNIDNLIEANWWILFFSCAYFSQSRPDLCATPPISVETLQIGRRFANEFIDNVLNTGPALAIDGLIVDQSVEWFLYVKLLLMYHQNIFIYFNFMPLHEIFRPDNFAVFQPGIYCPDVGSLVGTVVNQEQIIGEVVTDMQFGGVEFSNVQSFLLDRSTNSVDELINDLENINFDIRENLRNVLKMCPRSHVNISSTDLSFPRN